MTSRAVKLAAATLMLSLMITAAATEKTMTRPPALSPGATAAAFDEYAGSLERLLREAEVNNQHAWGLILGGRAHSRGKAKTDDVAAIKIAQQNVERQVDAAAAPANVSGKASVLFSAAQQAAADAASDYVKLAGYFDVGGHTGNLSGVADDMSDTAEVLRGHLAAFHKAVTTAHRELAVR